MPGPVSDSGAHAGTRARATARLGLAPCHLPRNCNDHRRKPLQTLDKGCRFFLKKLFKEMKTNGPFGVSVMYSDYASCARAKQAPSPGHLLVDWSSGVME